jgi:ribosomal protein L35
MLGRLAARGARLAGARGVAGRLQGAGAGRGAGAAPPAWAPAPAPAWAAGWGAAAATRSAPWGLAGAARAAGAVGAVGRVLQCCGLALAPLGGARALSALAGRGAARSRAAPQAAVSALGSSGSLAPARLALQSAGRCGSALRRRVRVKADGSIKYMMSGHQHRMRKHPRRRNRNASKPRVMAEGHALWSNWKNALRSRSHKRYKRA